MVKIAVDAMGGDNAPQAIVDGVFEALEEIGDVKITLVGKEDEVKRCMAGRTDARIEILHAPDEIDMAEPPVNAIKTKTQSSMVVGLNLASSGEADVFVTAGSTGAAIAGGTLVVRRIKGIKRPALAPLLPTRTGRVLLIDCGANTDCRPEHLLQFGIMGSLYMEKVLGIKNPRVGLANNGAEEEKGNALTKEAYKLLNEANINFVGNAEGRYIVSGDFDVIVADGFVGNMLMKFMEGVAITMFSMIKDELTSSFVSKVGAAMSKGAYKKLKNKLDYTEYGAAPMLGLRAGVLKAHGSSKSRSIAVTIKQAVEFKKYDVVNTISNAMEERN